MKIDIIIPFIDLRRLNSAESLVVNKKPYWPGPTNGFMRCTGSINSKQSGFAYNGIKLVGKKIPGLIELKRNIEFPYNSNIFGMYVISFRLKKHSFSKLKSEELLSFFHEDVQFKVVNLTSKYRSNKIKITNLKNLWKELQLQYYWASRKLVEKNENGKIERLYDIVNGDISMKNINDELMQIKFIGSYLFFESSEYKHLISDKKNYHSLSGIEVSKLSQKWMSIFHIKRKWFTSILDLNEHSHFLYAFERFILFFEMYYTTVEELEDLKEIDDRFLWNYVRNIDRYLDDIKSSEEYRYFVEYLNFLDKQNSKILSNLIAKINNSSKLSETQKIKLINRIEDMQHTETIIIH